MKELKNHEIMQVSGGVPQYKNALYCALVFGIGGAAYGLCTSGTKGALDGAEYAILGGLIGTAYEGIVGLIEIYDSYRRNVPYEGAAGIAELLPRPMPTST